jgi:uncharacterized protein Yka (UPF0111/DUF47 family)
MFKTKIYNLNEDLFAQITQVKNILNSQAKRADAIAKIANHIMSIWLLKLEIVQSLTKEPHPRFAMSFAQSVPGRRRRHRRVSSQRTEELFDALEQLSNPNLTKEELDAEIVRARAIRAKWME